MSLKYAHEHIPSNTGSADVSGNERELLALFEQLAAEFDQSENADSAT